MSLNDPLANTMSSILNSEKIAIDSVIIKPMSKLIKECLKIMNEKGYVGSFNEVSDGKGNFLELSLLGKINNCGVVKPRFNVKCNNLEKFEKRFLPSKDFGILIISTNKGMMTHKDAREKNLGGKLIAFCY